MNRVPHDAEMKVEDVPPFVFGLMIGNHVRLVGDGSELCLSGLLCLKSVVVGIDSLYDVEWIIRNMPRLESLRFEESTSPRGNYNSGLHICCCNSLKSVTIGNNLFHDGQCFELNHLPLLESITIGMNVCFSHTSSIEFSSDYASLFTIRTPLSEDNCDW